MRKLDLNLARRPFVNDRPLVLATAAVALALAFASFWNVHSLLGSLARGRETAARGAVAHEVAEMARAQSKLLENRTGDRDERRIRMVSVATHAIIQKRRLSWARLLDQLELILPRDVRILSISPDVQDHRVALIMECIARGGAGQQENRSKLLFYAKLQEPPFRDAYLLGESIEDGKLRFQIKCNYDPVGPDAVALYTPPPWESKPESRPAPTPPPGVPSGAAPARPPAGPAATATPDPSGGATPGLAPPGPGALPGLHAVPGFGAGPGGGKPPIGLAPAFSPIATPPLARPQSPRARPIRDRSEAEDDQPVNELPWTPRPEEQE